MDISNRWHTYGFTVTKCCDRCSIQFSWYDVIGVLSSNMKLTHRSINQMQHFQWAMNKTLKFQWKSQQLNLLHFAYLNLIYSLLSFHRQYNCHFELAECFLRAPLWLFGTRHALFSKYVWILLTSPKRISNQKKIRKPPKRSSKFFFPNEYVHIQRHWVIPQLLLLLLIQVEFFQLVSAAFYPQIFQSTEIVKNDPVNYC